MRKRDALKLRPGDWIAFGTHAVSATYRRGEVLHVTPNGGIKVLMDSGAEQWVSYHYVHPGIDASDPHFNMYD